MHKLALQLQKEATAGADLEKLEEKAYEAAGDPSIPEIDLGIQVPDEIPVEYRKLMFDLNTGQVSEVIENDHEYLFFKCIEKHPVPMTEAKQVMGWLRLRDARRLLKDSVKTQLNEQYFLPFPAEDQREAGEQTTP
jgi:parvulin-like peptidyl-prolyl isomerase